MRQTYLTMSETASKLHVTRSEVSGLVSRELLHPRGPGLFDPQEVTELRATMRNDRTSQTSVRGALQSPSSDPDGG